MVLFSDAAPYIATKQGVTAIKFSKDILEAIEDDLDIDEKISVLFLMITDYTDSFQEVYHLLQRHKEHKTYVLKEFINNHEENWKNKILEAICIIQNRQIIRKLGISYSDLELLYLPNNRLCSRNINLVAKCLYLLCEELTEDEITLLLQYVKSDLNKYEESLNDIRYLELHMLYWIQEKYISVYSGGKANLKNLLKHIKRFDDLGLIYEDLKGHDNHQNVLDVQNANCASASHLETFSMREDIVFSSDQEEVKKIKKGLCIIISQMVFLGQKFETRYGTLSDCIRLSETFKGFGFTIELFHNLKKDEMLKQLEDIAKVFGTDYDCLFVCILTHGCKGGIISSDEQEISLEVIEHTICCEELKDIIKIVIIQACQGQATGQVKENLTTDGGNSFNTSNILQYRNFCIFMSTMQGFVSVRHKEEGSWFIQELCNVLQTEGSKTTFMKVTNKIIQSVIQKRGKLSGTTSVAQLPELRPYRLLTDFQLPEYKVLKY
ncbi:PREDICTED: caspase-8 [Dufourea novaeangliae]|uniref:caspase-8 n=1 Tax=Dufourea novaeangliae TaxID=178035 RepID=UPI0007670369|nr:PREDICTED: caspase-8 [Dufourea novaeangliae]